MGFRKHAVEAFVRELSAKDLASVLLELADTYPEVRQRLVRMRLSSRPDRLAVEFRKTLDRWRGQDRYLNYREVTEWESELHAWLGQLERELMPRDPMATVALAEAFIESDGAFFERADDSGGGIGSAIRAACKLWLQAASRCEMPADEWPERLCRLHAADEYGAREALMLEARLLLSEVQLRRLVAVYEARADAAMTADGAAGKVPDAVRSCTSALGLLSNALRDPDIHVRAVLRHSPRPNTLQRQDFVLMYLQADRPSDALPWLEDPSDWDGHTRLRLLAEVHHRMGQAEQGAPLQKQVFEDTLSVPDFRAWRGHLPPREQSGALERARALALDHDDPATAALLLAEIEHFDEAEQVLVADASRIRGEDYGWLVPLAQKLENHAKWLGATVVYRALLDAVLAKAYAPAYRHGANYWHRLHAIEAQRSGLLQLLSHDAYIAAIRQKHARKVAFWARVGEGPTSTQRNGGDMDLDFD